MQGLLNILWKKFWTLGLNRRLGFTQVFALALSPMLSTPPFPA